MSKKAKLLQKCRQNTKNVRVDDAISLATQYGFVHRSGRHPHFLTHPNFEQPLNFQDRGGFVPRYQAIQLLEAIDALVAAGLEKHEK